ncbi:hypothetical protein Dvul_1058 [Nitratidesulfovibrio vulgaris DP4]|uniref:Uncharacterized protein n=1 Tax=Nitratidesulfovibrio vulgaris (strain DP4) TaxID=391774 RepID=A0A0H3A7S0_NITV4|nr:hypothetical protein Dvul_1058 [Nitratidesulfovibrio vulgaris DP4]
MNREHVDSGSADYCPLSLRHVSATQALDDAIKIVAFLRDIVFRSSVAAEVDDSPMDQNAIGGMQLVTDLLADKLYIASGRYHLPGSDVGNSLAGSNTGT